MPLIWYQGTRNTIRTRNRMKKYLGLRQPNSNSYQDLQLTCHFERLVIFNLFNILNNVITYIYILYKLSDNLEIVNLIQVPKLSCENKKAPRVTPLTTNNTVRQRDVPARTSEQYFRVWDTC